MKTNRCLLPLCALLLFAACNGTNYSVPDAPPRDDTGDISDVMVVLPYATGKELVERTCITCHSLRYIEMQPHMTEKSWDKTVTKMIKMYGAPVQDSADAAAIVRYLVAVKGKKS